jgi:hypothetical protein
MTGLFFDEQTPESLIGAIERFETAEKEGVFGCRNTFTEHVRHFSADAFKERIRKVITERIRV